MQPAWHLRPMLQADLDVVHGIEQRAYDFPWSRGILEDCLRSGYSSWVCEERLGRIVGYAFLAMGAGEGHILNLCVDPDWRRQGAAQHVLDHLLGIASAAGLGELFLEVRPSNLAAQQLYRANGFVEIGRRPNYYASAAGREDAIVLSRAP